MFCAFCGESTAPASSQCYHITNISKSNYYDLLPNSRTQGTRPRVTSPNKVVRGGPLGLKCSAVIMVLLLGGRTTTMVMGTEMVMIEVRVGG